MGTTIWLKDWRFTAFGKSLFEPSAFRPTDTPAFAFTFIGDPDKPHIAKQLDEIAKIEKEEFRKAYMASKGAKESMVEQLWSDLPWDDKVIRDGNRKSEYDGFEGMKFISARATPPRQAAPLIVDVQGKPLKKDEPGAPYGGARVWAQIEIWGQYGTYKGARATILGVQMFKDADAFGGGKPADPNAFGNLSDQGGDDEDDYGADLA